MTRIDIQGEIRRTSSDMFGEVPGTLDRVKMQVASGPAPYSIHVNSPGGSYEEALAAANFLRDLECEVYIDAACYSAATLFLTVGSKVTMRPGSLLMFHSPSCDAGGTSAELTNAVAYLDNVKASAAALYAARTKRPVEEMSALMDGETWLTAEKAVEMGFADVAEGAPVEAVAFARYTAGMKVSATAPASVRLIADPVSYVAEMLGTTGDKITDRLAELKQVEATSAEMRANVTETAAKLLAETEAHKTTAATLKTAQDAVLRFEERVALGVAQMAKAARVAPVVITPAEVKKDLMAQLNEIKDPAKRCAFMADNWAGLNALKTNN